MRKRNLTTVMIGLAGLLWASSSSAQPLITEIIDATGDGMNALVAPRSIAVDGSGNAYVGGNLSDNAFKITSAGAISEIIDATGDGTGNILDNVNLGGIAVDGAGNVYVAGDLSDNAFKITPGGVITEIIDSTGDGVNTLHFSLGVTVDGSGNVYLVGFGSQNVFKIATPGTCSTSGTPCTITEIIDTTGDGTNPLTPVGVAVDGSGNVYVSGDASRNVFKIATPGTCSTGGTPCTITEIIDAAGDWTGNFLDSPTGVAVDGSGNVYVAGGTSWDVFRIATPGSCSTGGTPCTITQIIDSTGDGVNGLSAPLGVTVDGSGNVYVAGRFSDNAFAIETPGTCSTGGTPCTITEIIDTTGDGTNSLLEPYDVAVDASDFVYVTGKSSDNVFAINYADADGDGVVDAIDNCTLVANASQNDTDCDGFGNRCDGDFDNSGLVDAVDTALFQAAFGGVDPLYDLDEPPDGLVGAPDFNILLALLGFPPGPGVGVCTPGTTFSIDFQGPTIATLDSFFASPITEGDILTTAPPRRPGPNPPLPGIGVVPPGTMVGAAASAAGSFAGGLGIVPGPGGCVEVDALSYGADVLNPASSGFFSVDEFAAGDGTPIGLADVNTEGSLGAGEASADVFSYRGPIVPTSPGPPIGNAAHIDGDGIAPSGTPGLGLIEPNPPSSGLVPDPGDNLVAVDVNTFPSQLRGPIYFSLDAAFPDPLESSTPANCGTAIGNGFSGADVLMSFPGGTPALAIAAAALGLDMAGPDTDDLDALSWDDADFSRTLTAGDTIAFSVRRGSAVIGTADSAFGVLIEEGDVLTVPASAGAAPAILIAGEAMGLGTIRGGTAGPFGADDVDAIDLPEPASALQLAAGLLFLAVCRRYKLGTRSPPIGEPAS
jgi:Beta-propeller repeat/Thrombospondin type 3 repeat